MDSTDGCGKNGSHKNMCGDLCTVRLSSRARRRHFVPPPGELDCLVHASILRRSRITRIVQPCRFQVAVIASLAERKVPPGTEGNVTASRPFEESAFWLNRVTSSKPRSPAHHGFLRFDQPKQESPIRLKRWRGRGRMRCSAPGHPRRSLRREARSAPVHP